MPRQLDLISENYFVYDCAASDAIFGVEIQAYITNWHTLAHILNKNDILGTKWFTNGTQIYPLGKFKRKMSIPSMLAAAGNAGCVHSGLGKGGGYTPLQKKKYRRIREGAIYSTVLETYRKIFKLKSVNKLSIIWKTMYSWIYEHDIKI